MGKVLPRGLLWSFGSISYVTEGGNLPKAISLTALYGYIPLGYGQKELKA